MDAEYTSSAVFISTGADILRCRSDVINTTFNRRFRAFFGTTPIVCSSLWGLLAVSRPPDSKPKHLLWALMFLRLYDTESVHALLAGVDEKTFRKWAWAFVRSLSKIELVRFVIYMHIYMYLYL